MKEDQLVIYGDNCSNEDRIAALQRTYAHSESQPLIKSFLQRATKTILKAAKATPDGLQELGTFTDLLALAETLTSHNAASDATNFALTISVQVAELLK